MADPRGAVAAAAPERQSFVSRERSGKAERSAARKNAKIDEKRFAKRPTISPGVQSWRCCRDRRAVDGRRRISRRHGHSDSSAAAAIERQYARFFDEQPGAKIEIKIDAIRPIGADAAIEDGHASLLPRSRAPASGPYTVIHAKVDGRWLMASVREPQRGKIGKRRSASSLDWLVGSWQAEQNGGKMDVTFRWVANRNFLERAYSVEQGGRITTSGVQLIGREAGNPRASVVELHLRRRICRRQLDRPARRLGDRHARQIARRHDNQRGELSDPAG